MNETDHGDDNTPFVTGDSIEGVINSLLAVKVPYKLKF